ncbi:MAG: SDR family oxidoreductase [Sporomusaceae bacterium]|nr:SDR family oxidoreductase [Sporomusaceae bacterium]
MEQTVLQQFFSLEGRVGIVTGASSGIGRGIAHLLADAGAKVYNFSRRPTRSEDLDFGLNPNVTDIAVDITDFTRVQTLVRQIGEAEGLDFLVNNAGMTKRTPAEAVSQQWWQDIHTLNVDAPFFLAQQCFAYLSRSPHIGRIVNISSMAAHLGFAEVTPYCSTKAAVAGMTRGLAIEWAGRNILVNSVAPGWIQTSMTQTVADPDRLAKIINRMPLHRYGHPRSEVGAMVWFLVSAASSYITGQDFAVDGGALSYGF